ncbi:GNAT family N-acetyltransferase [Corynebacterium sp. CCUG 65737]|uniref:GNAT family N-acetyltransferase n=1 Tax=Corynebacterium sp. CCUG 65737 TaxID=2823889 RepID=UPI00210F1D90|nr:GNAT family N-acetyltransferase [Corynebacterium sp. CCUG 65737]
MLQSSALPLSSGRTRLRRMTDSDAAAYAAGTKDGMVRKFAHLPEPQYTPETVRTMIQEVVEPGLADGTLAVLALADAESDKFVGSMVVFDVGSQSAEVGFWIAPDSRGDGHAARGLELAASLARKSGLSALTARTVTANEASQRCLINAGFVETSRHTGTTPAGAQETLVHYHRELHPAP